MPWNNQGGGGWQGGNGQGPWGGRPSGGGGNNGGGGGGGGGGGNPQPPDLEELLRKSQEKVKNLFPGGGGSGGGGSAAMKLGPLGITVVAIVILGIWLLTGLYRVQPEERGVEMVFGKQTQITTPGLNWNWPSPIGSVELPQVERVNRIEVGYRSAGGAAGRTGASRPVSDESLMLTGDENIVDIHFEVQWVISDPANFLFNIRDPEATIKAAAESVMRENVGQSPIVEVTTEGRRAIEGQVREQLQELMVEYGAGVNVTSVQLQKADPPEQVIEAFRDVQRAQADRERAQNEAEAFANDIIPRARGEAEKLLQEAQAYEQEVFARATGEAERFKSILAEYSKAKDVTKQRIYLETMEEVLRGMDKLIVDDIGGSGAVPYLPLPELQRSSGASQ